MRPVQTRGRFLPILAFVLAIIAGLAPSSGATLAEPPEATAGWGEFTQSRGPDASIGLGPWGVWVGEDVYNTTGAGQTRIALVARGAERAFYVKIQNDGSYTDSFKLGGCSGGRRFAVDYFSGSTRITAAVIDGTYEMGDLAPGVSQNLRLVIGAEPGTAAGERKGCLVVVTSASDSAGQDAVKAGVRVATAAYVDTVTAGTDDWRAYRCNVAAAGPIRALLEWEDPSADLNLLLYDPGGLLVAASRSTTAMPEEILYDADATGTWKVGVKAKSGSSTYTLAVVCPGPSPPPPSQDPEVGRAKEAGIYEETRTYAAAVGDFDGDRREDFVLVRHSLPSRLYRNDGGHFAEVDPGFLYRNDRHDCDWADVDADGFPDFYCSVGAGRGAGVKSNELWMQGPAGKFTERATVYGVTDPLGRGRQVAFLDVNHDPYPDLFVGNYYPRTDGRLSPNHLYVNEGGTHFRDATEYGVTREVGGRCVQAADWNRDGWDDLLVCGNKSIRLYRNDGGVRFTDVTSQVNLHGFWRGAQLVDLNGDGRLDIAQVGKFSFQVRLQQWDDTFGGVSASRTLTAGRNVVGGDLDGDGDMDLYITEGSTSATDLTSNVKDTLLLNDGTGGAYVSATIPQTTRGRGDVAAEIDFDGDGRSDFIVLNGEGDPTKVPANAGPIQLISVGGAGSGFLPGPADDLLVGDR